MKFQDCETSALEIDAEAAAMLERTSALVVDYVYREDEVCEPEWDDPEYTVQQYIFALRCLMTKIAQLSDDILAIEDGPDVSTLLHMQIDLSSQDIALSARVLLLREIFGKGDDDNNPGPPLPEGSPNPSVGVPLAV